MGGGVPYGASGYNNGLYNGTPNYGYGGSGLGMYGNYGNLGYGGYSYPSYSPGYYPPMSNIAYSLPTNTPYGTYFPSSYVPYGPGGVYAPYGGGPYSGGINQQMLYEDLFRRYNNVNNVFQYNQAVQNILNRPQGGTEDIINYYNQYYYGYGGYGGYSGGNYNYPYSYYNGYAGVSSAGGPADPPAVLTPVNVPTPTPVEPVLVVVPEIPTPNGPVDFGEPPPPPPSGPILPPDFGTPPMLPPQPAIYVDIGTPPTLPVDSGPVWTMNDAPIFFSAD